MSFSRKACLKMLSSLGLPTLEFVTAPLTHAVNEYNPNKSFEYQEFSCNG